MLLSELETAQLLNELCSSRSLNKTYAKPKNILKVDSLDSDTLNNITIDHHCVVPAKSVQMLFRMLEELYIKDYLNDDLLKVIEREIYRLDNLEVPLLSDQLDTENVLLKATNYSILHLLTRLTYLYAHRIVFFVNYLMFDNWKYLQLYFKDILSLSDISGIRQIYYAFGVTEVGKKLINKLKKELNIELIRLTNKVGLEYPNSQHYVAS